MRRRLAFLSLAVASLVVVAFLFPVAILIRNQAQTRALSDAERDAQSVATALAVVGTDEGITPELADAILTAFGYPDDLSVIFVSGEIVGTPIGSLEHLGQAQSGAAFTAKTKGGAEVLVPVLTADAPIQGDTVVVRAFVSDEALSKGVLVAWAMLFGLGLFLIAIATFAADRLGRSVVRPVTELSDAAHEWGTGNLEVRVVPSGPEEIAEVGEAFNTLAGRLDMLLVAERESVADLSHRLRTPLTALRLQAETLADPGEAALLVADIDELERQVDEMIQRARNHSGGGPTVDSVDLGAVVNHRAAFWQVLADDQGRPTSISVEPGEHPVALQRADLGALVDVLVENVFAHTPAGVGYRLGVRKQGDGRSVLSVSDAGPGFGDLGVMRRGESGAGSTGLGLDIVVRTAERTGGDIRIGTSTDGGGEVTVVFGA
ncbi:MAG: HAMP domain-containing sensor histidine kinase [Acidimicrobiia bacterium]|nr:MAG: HAMP domain-containing sensor histidine kinase [Acidimicrobiia bacterium]